ncbi:hypothetical protein AAF712_000330 [Marasmius tenuissimus]|uniref:Uncharacterized protein n=1 Tax=Marasmius tenuissimus TaxID=585030 RepID=A0ABR3AJ21_9AGAR
MVTDISMKAFALIVLALPLTLADPVGLKDRSIFVAQGEKTPPRLKLFLSQNLHGYQCNAFLDPSNHFRRQFPRAHDLPIVYLYVGFMPAQAVRVDLGITNVEVTQGPPPADTSPGRSNSNTQTNAGITVMRRADSDPSVIIAEPLGSNIDAEQEGFTWDKVNVPQGWYILVAALSGTSNVIGVSGTSVFVRNGTNVSCLQNTVSTTSQSPPTGTQTSAPPSTDTGTPSGATQTSSVNIGGIVGGVVGGIALLAIIVFAACCWRRGKRRARNAGETNDKSGAINEGTRPGILPLGRWGKLGSGSFNDKDRGPAAAEVENGVGATAVATSATRSIGRPRSRSGTGGGFFAAVLKPSSSSVSPKKSPTKKPKKPYHTPRHNSHSESIGGMLSSSATTTMTGSSAFHGTDDEYNPYSYERPMPMSPISAGGSSAASSFRASGAAADVRSPFSDPSDHDSDSVVYGLYATARESSTGVIPIGYDGPPISGAPTPSPIPSSHINSHYGSSTGAVAGHSSDSDRPDSRRSSRGHHDRSHSYSAFRDGRDQQQHERVRAQTLLGGMYTLPNSQQQSLPETPRNDSMLTFSTSSSAEQSRRGSRSHASPSPSIPMQASPSSQSSTTMGSSTNHAGGTFGANATRRAVRKPVPTYSPNELASSTDVFGSSSAPTSPGSSPTAGSPLTPADGTVSDGQREIYRQHELLHKDSMGSLKGTGKMHVLIPDMPPPQRG